jgi:hypothetical protein
MLCFNCIRYEHAQEYERQPSKEETLWQNEVKIIVVSTNNVNDFEGQRRNEPPILEKSSYSKRNELV